MFLTFEDRGAESPWVERIWTARSERAGEFLSVAAGHWEMVVTRHRAETFLTVRGPETRATTVDCPADGEWVAVRFKLGTFAPDWLPRALRDRRDVTLPGASARSFWLRGSAWEYPSYENADAFVARLIRKGVISRDPIVDTVLTGAQPVVSPRSAQRRFARATGLTHTAYRTIVRARHAANLLREGVPIVDAVYEAGYFDQPHLTPYEGMTTFGYPASLAGPIGGALLVSTILMLLPRTAVLGCILVTGYLGGATATQVRVEDAWFLFPVALGVLSWLGLYLRDARVRALLPFRA